MSVRKWTIGAVSAFAALAMLFVATAATAQPAAGVKAATINDIGGLGDKGFNDLCKEGLDDATDERHRLRLVLVVGDARARFRRAHQEHREIDALRGEPAHVVVGMDRKGQRQIHHASMRAVVSDA